MKKLTGILLMAALCLALLAGCGSEEKKLSAEDLARQLAESIEYEDEIALTNEDMARLLYGYDESAVVQAQVYLSAGATTEEAAVFECQDEAAAEAVLAGAKDRIEAQKVSVQSYKPEELSRLEGAIVQAEGRYVIVSISGTPEEAQKIIDRALGK